ncbi:MAG: PQQ-binding-like beta-propeller repeat protein [Planctomycetaceae bacterium]|nr:PQQ-binding-like beta-propeller repeat protein [Planctomycetaceae bacterium]
MSPNQPLLLAVLLLTAPVTAGDWPNWRGPHGNGVADGTGYPAEWSAEKNIRWKYQIPGIGASTPAVTGDHIFVTSTHDGKNLVTCVDMAGQQVWSKEFGTSIEGKQGKDGTGANPSPVTDGERVYVYFKSGDFGCFSLKGDLLWQTNVFERFAEVTSETLWWDLGTSPVLTSNAIVVTMMHSGPSYLAAFEPSSGKLLWKHDRVTDAPREAAQSYTTPIVTKNPDGREVIIVTGADYVTCHDASNGSELWRVGTLNPEHNEYFRSISSSVVGEGVVVAPYARGGTLTAIKMGGTGDVTKSHVLWTNQDTSADVPTPAIAGDRVFVVRDVKNDRGTVDCLELLTGRTIWSGQLEKHRLTFRASPIVADGKVYVTRQDGTVFVLDAVGNEFKVIATNQIGDEHAIATPVFIDGKILLRTQDNLYLISG